MYVVNTQKIDVTITRVFITLWITRRVVWITSYFISTYKQIFAIVMCAATLWSIGQKFDTFFKVYCCTVQWLSHQINVAPRQTHLIVYHPGKDGVFWLLGLGVIPRHTKRLLTSEALFADERFPRSLTRSLSSTDQLASNYNTMSLLYAIWSVSIGSTS